MVDVAPTPHPAQPHQPRHDTPSHNRPDTPKIPEVTGPSLPARPRPGVCTLTGVRSGPIQTRCLPLPVRGASRAPAGAVVFHRYLEDLNRAPHASARPVVHREPDRYDPAPDAACRSAPQPGGPRLLPRLGEVLPVEPEPRARMTVEVRRLQRTAVTGRLIDLMA